MSGAAVSGRLSEEEGAVTRLLKRLSRASVWIVVERGDAGSGAWRLRAGAGRVDARTGAPPVLTVPAAGLGQGLRRQMLRMTEAGTIEVTDLGRARLRRALAGEDGFRAQHQARGLRRDRGRDGSVEVMTVNHAESPLAWLRTRRTRDGKAFLNAEQFEAGERLRADHTFGQIAPGLAAPAWQTLATGATGGGSRRGGIGELTDAVMAARQRMERALDAVGPELSGVLVDVCCLLKGLETVERERGWPARSAKVILAIGLSRLARHYGLGCGR